MLHNFNNIEHSLIRYLQYMKVNWRMDVCLHEFLIPVLKEWKGSASLLDPFTSFFGDSPLFLFTGSSIWCRFGLKVVDVRKIPSPNFGRNTDVRTLRGVIVLMTGIIQLSYSALCTNQLTVFNQWIFIWIWIFIAVPPLREQWYRQGNFI
jgi:hypothetical protein